jgi:hypothetical protein
MIYNYKGRIVNGRSITKSDTAENKYDVIYVGTAGNVVVQHAEDPDNVSVTYVCQSGDYLRVATKKVMSATTASNLVGGFVG